MEQLIRPYLDRPYEDIPEFCHVAKKQEIIEKEYSLVPSQYIEFLYNKNNRRDIDAELVALRAELIDLLKDESRSKEVMLALLEDYTYGQN